MATNHLPPPKPMDLKGNVSENWKNWKKAWGHWVIATKLDAEDDKIIVSSLYHVLGTETAQIAENLTIQDKTKPDSILKALSDHFEPQKNQTFERYLFNTATQGEETIDNYLNRLRKLATTCNFGGLEESLICDRIVIGIKDHSVRKRLIREKNLTLNAALDICRVAERAQIHMKQIDGETETVHSVKGKSFDRTSCKTGKPPRTHTKQSQNIPKKVYVPENCGYCGGKHRKGACPAYGKECSTCGRKNHFSRVCRTSPRKTDSKSKKKRQLHHIADSQTENHTDEYQFSDSDSVASVYVVKTGSTQYIVQPLVKEPKRSNDSWIEMAMQIDNGSAVNCIRHQDLVRITTKPHIKKSEVKLTAYSGDIIKPIGQVDLDIKINNRQETLRFQVIDNAPTSLISGQASEDLGLIKVNRELLVNSVSESQPLTKEQIIKEYKDVFQGLGDIGEYKIDLDPNAKPKQDAPRTVPIALKSELRQRLSEMTAQGIIIQEKEPTEWVNSAVYVRRPGKKIRVCLDPKTLNKSIKVPKYHMPTLDDITPELAKVRVFTICDAKDGFLQIRLDETSSKYTTFHTPFGRYRWLRMPFGISSAPEEFQRRTIEILEGLNGVYAIADDCLIVGSGETVEQANLDHDKNFIQFLERCRERHYKLNLDKLRFRMETVKYHGHILTSNGLLPDPEKVEAIQQMPRPRDKTETKRLLGMITYLSKFVPQLSEVSQPLRDLTRDFHSYGQKHMTRHYRS